MATQRAEALLAVAARTAVMLVLGTAADVAVAAATSSVTAIARHAAEAHLTKLMGPSQSVEPSLSVAQAAAFHFPPEEPDVDLGRMRRRTIATRWQISQVSKQQL